MESFIKNGGLGHRGIIRRSQIIQLAPLCSIVNHLLKIYLYMYNKGFATLRNGFDIPKST